MQGIVRTRAGWSVLFATLLCLGCGQTVFGEDKPAPVAAPAPKPEEAKPAPKKPKVEDDDTFKISADEQLSTRGWTDDTGSFQIQGRLVALLDGKVRILKDSGKTTTVPLDRLSIADQQYVDVVAARYGNGPIGQVAAR